MDSILNSVKKMLGIQADYDHFDPEIIIYINGVLSTLTQIGVGSDEGFNIQGPAETWSDFIPEDKSKILQEIKPFVYMKVRTIFDPPTSSFALESMNKVASEYEWRIHTKADPAYANKDQNLQDGGVSDE